jgi:hypothetical protein
LIRSRLRPISLGGTSLPAGRVSGRWLGWIGLCCLLIGFSGRAWAGPNSGGVLLLHANLSLTFTTEGDFRGYSDLRDCKEAVTRVPGDGEGVILFALAAWDFGSPTLKAMTFGIKYSSYQVKPVTFGPCISPFDLGNGALEIKDGNWPESGSGTMLVWAEPLTDQICEVYWFACYAYDGNTFQVTPYPDPKIGGRFADSSIPAEQDDIEGYGMIGFGKNGINPCGGDESNTTGGCCFPDGQCRIRTRSTCENSGIGYTYLGDYSLCNPNPCAPGVGACCFGFQCRLMLWDECLQQRGTFYQSVGCDPLPCRSTQDASWGELKTIYRVP